MSSYVQQHGNLANNAGRFFGGLLIGGLIGAGALLLWAPQSGKKTRRQIQHDGMELRDRVTETVEDAVEQVRDTSGRVAAGVRKQTKKLQQRGQDMFDEQKEVVSQVVEAEKTAIENITNG
jgi:gas vesicle protein